MDADTPGVPVGILASKLENLAYSCTEVATSTKQCRLCASIGQFILIEFMIFARARADQLYIIDWFYRSYDPLNLIVQLFYILNTAHIMVLWQMNSAIETKYILSCPCLFSILSWEPRFQNLLHVLPRQPGPPSEVFYIFVVSEKSRIMSINNTVGILFKSSIVVPINLIYILEKYRS